MSNINPQSIDGTYPIAGQDNNSQGFRDNFTNTVNNFTFAAAELTDLQQNAVLKAALGSAGQSGTPTNDMNYAFLTHAQLKGTVETRNAIGNVTTASGLTVDWSTGHWQTAGLTDTTTSMAFSSTWPTSGYFTKLRLQLKTYANICALTFPSSVTNVSTLQGYTSGTTVNLPAGALYVFEFMTDDAGSTVRVQDVLRNYDADIDFTNLVVSGYAGISGNVIGGLARFASINSTPIGNATPASGAFTTLSATGNVTFAGGTVDTGYQFSTPTANVAVTALPGKSRLILTPTGPIISFGANVTLPGGNVDGTTFSISSNVATTLSVQASNGTSLDPYGNVQLVAGTSATYLYYATDTKWFKID